MRTVVSNEFGVTLVSTTSDAEKNILYIARVSSNQENEDPKLINYLVRNKHWSPFEHAFMTVEIITSRAIAQQILRHRSFTFQEFSQRYAKPAGTIKYKARRQAEKNRQSSIDNLPDDVINSFRMMQEDLERYSFELYKEAVDAGVAKECARFLLPVSTETKLYMTGSIRSWIHYFDIRCDEHTQWEHREIAIAIRAIFNKQFPIIAKALEEYYGTSEARLESTASG